jgi:dihydrofolate reductase
LNTVHPLVLVAAVAENGVIGRDGQLPWWLPGDLKHFRALTMGKPVIMGRRTFASLGRPLDGRANIVVTGDPNFRPQGVLIAPNLVSALARANDEAERMGAQEIVIIGGSALYAETLPIARRIYLTEVHAKPEGNAHFPPFDKQEWREVAREGPLRGSGDVHSYSFVTLDRRY